METPKKPKELIQVIKEYLNLQDKLMIGLKDQLGDRDWKYLTDVPRIGKVQIHGKVWSYSVHGTGVRFQFDKLCVDMNRNLDGEHRAFDAGRLAEYLESLGTNEIIFENEIHNFDFDSGPNILRGLCHSGLIRRLKTNDGEIYEL